jgi:hypothetical protein
MLSMDIRNPSPIIARHLTKNDEMLYVVVERLSEPEIVGDLFRLRAHYHPVSSRRTADWSNIIVKDETGNKYELRIALVRFLLERRDDGWEVTSASNLNALPDETDFGRLDNP